MHEPTLFLVGTPIGNLGDLSPRAVETLSTVDTVYAEDTRRTSGLFRRFGIRTPLRSLHEHNEASRCAEAVERLEAGERCALVTDAGSPGVSDPGARLVRAVANAGFPVVVVPGPSAVTAAVATSGFDADRFLFLGFPPRRGRERAIWLETCLTSPVTVVAFEAPGRIAALLSNLADRGIGDRAACVCRELTKIHEETRRGTVSSLRDYYQTNEARGEITFVLAGAPAVGGSEGDLEAARTLASRLRAEGLGTREILERLRMSHGLARNEAYAIAVASGEEEGRDP